MKKRGKGHYCIVCGEMKPNEQFTGRGHRNHVCKSCGRLSEENRLEILHIQTICGLSDTKRDRRQLQLFMNSKKYSGKTRAAAREHWEMLQALSNEEIFEGAEEEYWFVETGQTVEIDEADDDIPF